MKKSVLMAMLLMVATGLMFVSCQKDNFGDGGDEELGETTYTIRHTNSMSPITFECQECDRNGRVLATYSIPVSIRTLYAEEDAKTVEIYAMFTTKMGRYLEYNCGTIRLKKGKNVEYNLEKDYKFLRQWLDANYDY